MKKLLSMVLLGLAGSSLLFLSGCDSDDAEEAEIVEMVSSMQERVHELEAESEIRRKLQTYMEVLGAADWDNYVYYFTEDAKLIMTEGTRTGRDDIKERMSSATARMSAASQAEPVLRRADLLSSILVDVDGHTATAESRFTFISENAEGGFEVAGSGMYWDEWAFEDDEWRISSREIDYDLLRLTPRN